MSDTIDRFPEFWKDVCPLIKNQINSGELHLAEGCSKVAKKANAAEQLYNVGFPAESEYT